MKHPLLGSFASWVIRFVRRPLQTSTKSVTSSRRNLLLYPCLIVSAFFIGSLKFERAFPAVIEAVLLKSCEVGPFFHVGVMTTLGRHRGGPDFQPFLWPIRPLRPEVEQNPRPGIKSWSSFFDFLVENFPKFSFCKKVASSSSFFLQVILKGVLLFRGGRLPRNDLRCPRNHFRKHFFTKFQRFSLAKIFTPHQKERWPWPFTFFSSSPKFSVLLWCVGAEIAFHTHAHTHK